jgi:hypothetical protein
VDHVPRRAGLLYDNDIQRLNAGGADDRRRVP